MQSCGCHLPSPSEPGTATTTTTTKRRCFLSAVPSFGSAVLLLFLVALAGSPMVSADELPRILQEPQSAVLAHHQEVYLRCRVEPPTARVAWLFNGEPLDPARHHGLKLERSDLHFPRFRHGSASGSGSGVNDGEYRCTAGTGLGTVVSKPAVLSKPVLHRFQPRDDVVIEAWEGGYATIPCEAPFSNPPAMVRVQTSSGRLLNPSLDNVHPLPSGSVLLTNLRNTDSDNYTCVAVNPASGRNQSATHRVRLSVVRGSPERVSSGHSVVVDPRQVTLDVISGQSVLLECPLAGLGSPRVQWSRVYMNLTEVSHNITPFGNLRISSVSVRDSGTYICRTPSKQSRQILLNVQMAPTVSPHPGDALVQAEVGDTVKLSCKGEAFPPPSVTWFHDGRLHGGPAANSAGDVHSVVLSDITVDQAGIYVCELSNVLGHASAAIHLDVMAPDGQTLDDQGDTAGPANGSEEDLALDKSDGLEDNNRNFHLRVQNNNNNNKQRSNGGKKKGRRRKNRRKKNGKKGKAKKVKLIPPSAPTVSRLSDTEVMVQWNVPDNDGLAISFFRIQYKEVQPQSGQWKTVGHEDHINAKARRYKVYRLKPDATYKFRVAAVYSNNDNRNSANSRRFHLRASQRSQSLPPRAKPLIVEAKPSIYQNIYAINIKWRYIPEPSSSITGFHIYFRPSESEDAFRKVTLKEETVRSHVLQELSPDTEYSIKMQAFNAAGSSDYSNPVFMRTLPMEGQPRLRAPTPLPTPDSERDTPAPGGATTSRREAGGLDQPVILGIVLGVMLLVLIVFIAMCWWKQRQQKRRNQSSESCAKFQDQSQRIYSDSLRKKRPNGGPYPALNGLPPTMNGHGPPRGHHHMNVEVNPLDHLEHLGPMHQRSLTPSQHDLYSGKPYHQGNGVLSNGTLPGYGHNSDNNFNNIRHTVSSEDGLNASNLSHGDLGSMQRAGLGGSYHRPHHYPHLSAPHSKTSLSSFSQRRRKSSLSDEVDSPDELEPLSGQSLPLPHYRREMGPPAYPSLHGKVRHHRDNRQYRPCYGGYEGGFDPRYPEEGADFQRWMVPVAPSPSASSHTGKHKRRRKRAHSEREHTMRDQATNTDLSSNGEEGTIELGALNKSPSSSVSNGSDNSFSGSVPADSCPSVTMSNCAAPTLVSNPVTVIAVGPL